MVELNGVRIWAVAYVEGRPMTPRKLACGTVVERFEFEAGQPDLEGIPGRIVMPGRPDVSLSCSGLFRLPSGEVAAVYGAVVEALG